MIKVLVVEDEAQAAKDLIGLISFIEADIKLLGWAQSLDEAEELISTKKPDLLFLDIEVGEANSVHWLTSMQNISFKVIFTTGHNDYAIDAFRLSAVDYLLKPIVLKDLSESISKVSVNLDVPTDKHVDVLQENLTNSSPNRLILSDAESVYAVEFNEIIRCEASSNYTIFYLTQKRQLVISKSLKVYETILLTDHFFRIHKSHLINLNYFARYNKQEGGSVILKDDTILPVAPQRRESLIASLSNIR